jgi:multidrug efflux system membrane fusion protein
VPERDFEELRKRAGIDKALSVRVMPSGADSSAAVTGTLVFVDNQVDRATGSVLLKAEVPNQDRALWPGQFVSVALQLSVDQDAVTIPSEAVVTSGTSTFVYVLDGDKAKRTPVKVGRSAGTLVKIDSGLAGGERVVTEGQTRLRDGATVQLRGATPSGGGRNGGGRNGGGRNGGGQNGGGPNGGSRPAGQAGGATSGGQGGPGR